MTDAALEKRRLRALLRARREGLPDAYTKEAGKSIQTRVLGSALYRDAASVFCYVSVPREPDTGLILRQTLADGKALYVPKCVGGWMLAVRVHDLEDLRPGAYGIPEPVETPETIDAAALDLIVTPCLAAATDGRRLGHGAGYYDRFLAGAADRTVCLCFRRMLSEEIPVTDDDVPMTWVVTERPD